MSLRSSSAEHSPPLFSTHQAPAAAADYAGSSFLSLGQDVLEGHGLAEGHEGPLGGVQPWSRSAVPGSRCISYSLYILSWDGLERMASNDSMVTLWGKQRQVYTRKD